jgi:hypothetical protein
MKNAPIQTKDQSAVRSPYFNTSSRNNLEALTDRLEKIKRTGSGRWMACCPSHSDRTASLSLRELDDGRILLHCFAGCSVGEILDAIGLTINDLYPQRLANGRPERKPFPSADVLRAISFEAQVVAIAAADIAKGVLLDITEKNRILLASQRINSGLIAAGVNHG